MSEVGSTLGRFEIEGRLGSGGMGEVFLARDPSLGRRVALKVVNDHAAGKDAHARLLREARAAAALEHPNAVIIYEVGEIDGRPYIAMEHIRGRSLRSEIGETTVALETRVEWLTDVARALAAAHRAGIVHRDVKPENVMVREDGGIKVLDFGIARQRGVDASAPTSDGSTAEGATLTAPGVTMGTPAYMAPEQIRGEAVDGRTDQFAWAVMAYELLCGRLPWSSTSGLPLLAAVLTAEPVPLSERADLPVHLPTVIHRALSKSPEDRFADMSELLDVWTKTTGSRKAQTLAPARDEKGRAVGVRWIAAIVAMGAIAGAMYLVTRSAPPAAVPTASAIVSSPPPASASSSRAFAVPATTVPEARAAYVSALQAFRDGAINDAMAAFERAAKLDEGLAGAHLRLSLLQSSYDPIQARSTFQRARELRSLLSPFDQELLEALEPRVMRTPQDHVESAKRLERVVEKFPHEPEVHFALGMELFELSRREDALASLDRALQLDPTFTRILVMKSGLLTFDGEFEEAIATCNEVLSRSPGATGAYATRALIHTQEGHCELLASMSATWMAAAPSDQFAPDFRAMALASTGAPKEAVEEAMARRWAMIPEPNRRKGELQDRLRLSAWQGDFKTTEELARELKQLATGSDEMQRAEPLLALARVALETGRDEDARKIGADYFVARQAWSELPGNDDYTMGADPRTPMISVLRRAGEATDVYEKRRKTWLDEWASKKPAKELGGHVWMHAYPMTAHTEEDARQALAALPKEWGIPKFRPFSLPELGIGRMFRLTGDLDRAIEWLERGTKTCNAVALPFDYMRAWLELGIAREAKKDEEGACAAYGAVVERWGRAVPRSVTADEAKARQRALKCGGTK